MFSNENQTCYVSPNFNSWEPSSLNYIKIFIGQCVFYICHTHKTILHIHWLKLILSPTLPGLLLQDIEDELGNLLIFRHQTSGNSLLDVQRREMQTLNIQPEGKCIICI